MTRAFFLAPLIPLAMIYLWTAAHLGWPHALFAIFNPVVWLLALFFGLPVFYLFEILLALPLHRALQRAGRTGWVEYALAGAAVGTVACSVWTEFIRWGPTRIHKDFFYFVPIVIVAGAVGGIAFWRIAVRAIDGAGDEPFGGNAGSSLQHRCWCSIWASAPSSDRDWYGRSGRCCR